MVRAIDFNGDGLTGLAILTSDGLFIYRSNGQGGFLPPTEINVGFEPNGLTVADLTGNGNADLLVSNPLGDVLVLIGNGDGTFQPVQNLDQQVVAGGLRPERKHAGRVHLRRSAHRSARRPDRRRRHDRPGKCVHRADHPGRGHAGGPQQQRDPRPDRRQQRQQQRPGLPRAGERDVRPGARTTVTASSPAPTRWESPSPTSTATAGPT